MGLTKVKGSVFDPNQNDVPAVINVKEYGATGNGSTNDTTTVTTALSAATDKVLYFPEGTYLLDGLSITESVTIAGAGQDLTVLKASSSSGSLDFLDISIGGVILQDFTVDLANSTNTFAGGYVADRIGVNVQGPGSNTYYSDFSAYRVKAQNCGTSGFWIQWFNEISMDQCVATRCGQHGFRIFSSDNGSLTNCRALDIYPGNTGTTPYLNAYGFTLSNSTGSSENPCRDWDLVNCYAEDVTSWEGFDTHFGKRIRFLNCSTKNCNQGIAIESTTAGYESEDISIIGGSHNSFGQSYSRGGQTYEPSGAVTANMGSSSANGEGLIIQGVVSRVHGSGRDSSNGAIKIQDAESVLISDNILVGSLKRGIACVNETKNTVITNNIIDGVTSVGSLSRGIEVSSTAGEYTGLISNTNQISGVTNQSVQGLEVTIASGSITAFSDFHTVDTESDASTDDLVTINGGWYGREITLCAANSSRTVVLKDSTGNLRLNSSSDRSLTHSNDTITLVFSPNDVWVEKGFSDNET